MKNIIIIITLVSLIFAFTGCGKVAETYTEDSTTDNISVSESIETTTGNTEAESETYVSTATETVIETEVKTERRELGDGGYEITENKADQKIIKEYSSAGELKTESVYKYDKKNREIYCCSKDADGYIILLEKNEYSADGSHTEYTYVFDSDNPTKNENNYFAIMKIGYDADGNKISFDEEYK